MVEKRCQRFLTTFELFRLAYEHGDSRPLVWFLGSGLRLREAVALRAGEVDGRRVRVEESATEIDGRGLTFGPCVSLLDMVARPDRRLHGTWDVI